MNQGVTAPGDASAIQGQELYLDCFSGIAGDMFLGAMLDLGVPQEVIRRGIGRIAIDGYELQIGRRAHMSISGCDVKVLVSGEREGRASERGHSHPPTSPSAHGHRSYREIRSLIDAASLPEGVSSIAHDIFQRIAVAEGRMHDVDPEQVTFHEVGAIDSIVDIVGAALALDWVRPTGVSSRPIPLGSGQVRCAHGVMPVPAPATLAILAGAEVEDGGLAAELCTPTGAAIAAATVKRFGAMPAGRLVASGYGAGDRSLADRPNHLRIVVIDDGSVDPVEHAVIVEANIDDMNPQWCAVVMERLFVAGALDVWYTPIVMKKGRPALTLSALCERRVRERVGSVLLEQSTTVGYRSHDVARRTLSRRSVEVQTPYGVIRIKEALDGERLVNATPEFDDCHAAAQSSETPIKEVYASAISAHRSWRSRR